MKVDKTLRAKSSIQAGTTHAYQDLINLTFYM